MKKKVIIISVITFLLVASLVLFLLNNRTFSLEKKYYGNSEFIELTISEYDKLIEDKESFAIFIYQPLCTTSYEFNKVLTEFANKNQISFYKMAFSDMKKTSLKEEVKYYPSFVIIKNGKVVDSLDANSDEDVDRYKKIDAFKEWFTSYVKLKKVKGTFTDSKPEEEVIEPTIDANLENVKYNENKVNIYFFWGDGCPHCKKEFEFFNSIKTEYGNYFVLNTFEVWNNEDNQKLLKQFAAKMGDEVTGIPYTIIGNKTFKGFNENHESKILDAIKEQYKNSYDVYFDKE